MNGGEHHVDVTAQSEQNVVWERLLRAYHTEEIVDGVIVRRVRLGYLVDFGGVTGFLPGGHLESLPVIDDTRFVDHVWSFKVLKCDPAYGRLVVSRRATLPKMEVENIDLEAKYSIGERLTGVVTQKLPFGTFVDLGEIVGFLPAEPDTLKLQLGQVVSIAVRRIDSNVQRVILQLDRSNDGRTDAVTARSKSNPKSAEDSDEHAASGNPFGDT